MASTFKNAIYPSIGTSLVDVYTAGVGVQATVIGVSIANVTEALVYVDVKVFDSSANTSGFLIKSAPVESGGSFIVVGGEQKVVLEANDAIRVSSSTASSVDCVMSVLEIS